MPWRVHGVRATTFCINTISFSFRLPVPIESQQPPWFHSGGGSGSVFVLWSSFCPQIKDFLVIPMKFSCPFAEKMETKYHKGVGLLHVLLWMGTLTKCGVFPAIGRDALLNVCTTIRDVMIWINSERAIRSRSVSFMNAFFYFFSFFGISSINWSSGALHQSQLQQHCILQLPLDGMANEKDG